MNANKKRMTNLPRELVRSGRNGRSADTNVIGNRVGDCDLDHASRRWASNPFQRRRDATGLVKNSRRKVRPHHCRDWTRQRPGHSISPDNQGVFCPVTYITSKCSNLSYLREHPNAIRRVTPRISTMTSFVRFFGLKAIAVGAALSMTAGLAFAGDNASSKNSIVDALKAAPVTRGLSASPKQDEVETSFINSVRNRSTRSLSHGRACPARRHHRQQAEDRSRDQLRLQLGRRSARPR